MNLNRLNFAALHSLAIIISPRELLRYFYVVLTSFVILDPLVIVNSASFQSRTLYKQHHHNHNDRPSQDLEQRYHLHHHHHHHQAASLHRLHKLLGLNDEYHSDSRATKITPQFMIDLYNTVTDSDGTTTSLNKPYNAEIVRSFRELISSPLSSRQVTDQDNNEYDSTKQLFIFNTTMSSLEENEFILGAELHLYRYRLSDTLNSTSTLNSSTFVIKVYQVLSDKSLEYEIDEHHRLLSVYHVSADDSGWLILDVREAVLSWLSGASANLGLLVTAVTMESNEPVNLELIRRNDELEEPSAVENKEPILVLFDIQKGGDFTGDGSGVSNHPLTRDKRHVPSQASFADQDYVDGSRRLFNPDDARRNNFEGSPTSAEIYQRALLKKAEEIKLEFETQHRPGWWWRARHRNRRRSRPRRPGDRRSFIEKRKDFRRTARHVAPIILNDSNNTSKEFGNDTSWHWCGTTGVEKQTEGQASEPCAKLSFEVSFADIGLSSIIAPKSYDAFQCRGHCNSPISQDQKPTNHATIQSIIYDMTSTLARSINRTVDAGTKEVLPVVPIVEMPSCVPIKLSPISVLYNDHDKDEIILKSFPDMVVVSCGCR